LNLDNSGALAAVMPREQASTGFSKRTGRSLRRYCGAGIYFIAQSLA
jgi:hypothetical protein